MKPKPARRRRGLRWVFFGVLFLLAGASASVFWLKGREVTAPAWLRDQISRQITAAVPQVDIRFGDVVFLLDDAWRPRISARDLTLRTAAGDEIVSVSDVRAGFDARALMDRRLSLRSLDANGVFLTLQRSEAGAVTLFADGNPRALRREAPDFARLISDLDEFLLRPPLEDLQRVEVQGITLRYEDYRAGRVWTLDGGRMRLERALEALQISLDLAVLGGASGVATVQANYAGVIGAEAADFGITVNNLDARDIASQGPAFTWMEALQAPISGALRGGVQEGGAFEPLNATFQIGAGVIQPRPEARPIPINGARSYFSYLPREQRLRFDEFIVDSKWGRGRLEGQAVLGPVTNGRISDLVGQFRLTDLSVNPDGLYPKAVGIEAAELDFRLGLAPFTLDIGRLQVSDRGQVLSADGHVTVDASGWDIAMNGQMDRLSVARLLELWPEEAKPKTRRWISENISKGFVKDSSAAIRIRQGSKPDIFLGFDFEEADFRFLKHMPPMQNARGHASLMRNRFVAILDEGGLDAPEGGWVDASGTSFIVPDTTAKPDPPGVVRIVAEGSVTATLALLDRPPLQLMQKADLPVALAEGQVAATGTISMPLKKGGNIAEVRYDVAGTVTDLQSLVLVKDRDLRAPELALTASETGVEIGGGGTLDGVPLDVVWRQPLGRPGERLPGQVTGTVEISQATLDTFRIALPPETLRGSGTGRITLDLLKGTPPRLAIRSDLQGIGLSVPPLGWSKPSSRAAVFEADVTLGDAPRVDRLLFEAPGLTARGAVTLTPDRTLERVRFDEVRVGTWLNAPVDLVGRGPGQPVGIVVRGGTVDLRKADLPSGGGGPSGPLSIALDRVRISDTLSITDMRGNFTTTGGLSGRFDGALNGTAPVSGQISPQGGRSAIRVESADVGQVLQAAGFATNARGGQIDLMLTPVGQDGAFDGKLRVADTRITGAPTIAALLNAISVVGLINELNGDGIFFSEITADFRLTPSRVTLREAAAVGASMGLSMDGTLETGTGRIALQGVISPVYMLNSIGSVLTRRGEGLFGFNYSIGGTTKSPEVFVNPLTALAPGGLRNLFRGNEPEVQLEEGEVAPVPEPRRAPVVDRGEDR